MASCCRSESEIKCNLFQSQGLKTTLYHHVSVEPHGIDVIMKRHMKGSYSIAEATRDCYKGRSAGYLSPTSTSQGCSKSSEIVDLLFGFRSCMDKHNKKNFVQVNLLINND